MSIEPVRKHITVAATQARAFSVFTSGIDRWWPPEHHIGASPLKRAVLEPKVGGRWYSICQDDSECEVGKVLLWEPPNRVVLAWQISGAWQYDPNLITEVEVKFTAVGPKETLVELEHRTLERFGDSGPEVRGMIDGEGGWGYTLERFAGAVSSGDV